MKQEGAPCETEREAIVDVRSLGEQEAKIGPKFGVDGDAEEGVGQVETRGPCVLCRKPRHRLGVLVVERGWLCATGVDVPTVKDEAHFAGIQWGLCRRAGEGLMIRKDLGRADGFAHVSGPQRGGGVRGLGPVREIFSFGTMISRSVK